MRVGPPTTQKSKLLRNSKKNVQRFAPIVSPPPKVITGLRHCHFEILSASVEIKCDLTEKTYLTEHKVMFYLSKVVFKRSNRRGYTLGP